MQANLKQIKTELKDISKKENFKFKHVKNHYQDMLEYYDFFSLNRKKHYLVFRFIYQKQEESISFIYQFEYNNKTKAVNETHSLSNHEADNLPGLTEQAKEMAKEVYEYAVEGDAIKNKVELKTQTELILKIFKENYISIINYVKKLSKEK